MNAKTQKRKASKRKEIKPQTDPDEHR